MTKGYPDWLRAFLLLGKYDTSYLPILLGADGSMYTVLQGEYGGELRTVKLDDEGRLSAFVIDSTDAWNQMLQIGNAELAARLGSIVRLDRRGTVLFLDDFEDGSSRWFFTSDGEALEHKITPLTCFSGGYSLCLTATDDEGNWMASNISQPSCLATSFGISVALRTPTEYTYVQIALDIYTGTKMYRIGARLNRATSKIQVYNALNAWQDVRAYVPMYYASAYYETLKIAGDVSTGKYIRLLWENTELDLSAIGIGGVDSNIAPNLVGALQVDGAVGTSAVAEFDDVIVTANET